MDIHLKFKSSELSKAGASTGPALFIIASIIVLTGLCSACRQQNDVRSAYPESESVRSQVKFIEFNVDEDSRLSGVTRLTLESTSVFDELYYGYDASIDAIFDDRTGFEHSDYLLSNENADLSIIWHLDAPAPTNQLNLESPVFPSFADGGFPFQRADPVIARPAAVISRTIQQYDGVNEAYNGDPVVEWSVGWLDAGMPTEWILQCVDPTSHMADTGCDFELIDNDAGVARLVVSFAIDPRSYAGYYHNHIDIQNIDGETVGQKTILRLGDENNHTLLEACLKPDGTNLTTDYCGISDPNATPAAKTVETSVLTSSESQAGGVQLRIVKSYYNQGDAAYYRLERRYTYKDNETRQLVSAETDTYELGLSQALTITESQTDAYTNGFLTKRTISQYSGGVLSGSESHSYQRDGQGRVTDYLQKDSSGANVLHTVYSFDDNGRLEQKRSYGYTNNIQNDTPICGENLDYSYEKDLDGGVAKMIANYCNGTVYQTIPHRVETLTYNANGALTSFEIYGFSGATTYALERIDYEYDGNGFNTKIQYYDGVGSAMTAAEYTIRESDGNLFVISEKNYNADGALITSISDSNSVCASNSSCYSKITYVYLPID